MPMELVTEPLQYFPITDANGTYVDQCPTSIPDGIRCSCGTRGNWVYDSRTNFKAHLVCASHKRWLAELNNSKFNFFKEATELRHLVFTQKKIIATMEKEINQLRGEVFCLAHANTFTSSSYVESVDLLDIND